MKPVKPIVPNPITTERAINVTMLLIAGVALLVTALIVATVFGLWLKLFWFGWVMAGR